MNKKQDHHYLRKAIELGRQGMEANLGGPFGALVVKNEVIVGQGRNQVTSSNDPTAHAEVVAIREACRNLNDFQLTGCTLYTSCEPCPMCLGAIYWARPDRVVFAADKAAAAAAGFDDEFIYRELVLPLEKRSILIQQLLPDEGTQLFREWMDKPDKIEY